MNNHNKPIRILLVDDHKSFSDGLTMLINTKKPLMEVVGSAKCQTEAIKAATASKPDIILLDVDLGTEDGIDILPDLIAQNETKVIILTGAQNPEIHEKGVLRGARGVLMKTDSAEVILKAIEKVYRGEIWLNNNLLNKVLGKLTQPNDAHQFIDAEKQKITSLTARERAIIRALVNDETSTNKEIADRLFISDSTLKNHLTTIYNKLEVRNRIELLKYAITHKLDKSRGND